MGSYYPNLIRQIYLFSVFSEPLDTDRYKIRDGRQNHKKSIKIKNFQVEQRLFRPCIFLQSLPHTYCVYPSAFPC
jgi:hypothetical protein